MNFYWPGRDGLTEEQIVRDLVEMAVPWFAHQLEGAEPESTKPPGG